MSVRAQRTSPQSSTKDTARVAWQGRNLFRRVALSLGGGLSPSGAERRGNFIVESLEPMPDLYAQRLQISGANGSEFSADVTDVVKDVVYFRGRG